MFRDFIYLDVDRVQSIIAQLEEGLLTDIITGKQREVSGKGDVAAGILSQFLPVSFSVQGKLASDIKQSKILHDYAYTVALKSLQDKRLLLEATDFDRRTFPVPESAFVKVNGSARIIDYQTLRHLATNKKTIDKMLNSRSPKAIQDIGTFIDVFYGDVVQSTVENREGVRFVGVLNREHLREAIRDLIFKYGSHLQGDWTLLAQVTRIPEPEDVADGADSLASLTSNDPASKFSSISDAMATMVNELNAFQEFMGSVTYPDIAVSPIALYREVTSFD